ncbi:MAG: Smr/MutS family protein [Rhodobacteraceae bacterium]|nr:Smr/MutS family protein [Paracoccaceae bacterium]
MSRRPRNLHPDERELWHKVAATTRALHPERPERPERVDLRELTFAPAPKKTMNLFQAFKVGEKARPHPVPHDLAPAPKDHLAAQPLRMDRKTFDRMARGKLQPEARIDLHGMTLAEAHGELIRFVLNAHSDGLRLVLIITGKGKRGEDHGPIPQRMGALRHQVPHWLALPPLGSAILQVTTASLKHGGEGAYYVYLRRSR